MTLKSVLRMAGDTRLSKLQSAPLSRRKYTTPLPDMPRPPRGASTVRRRSRTWPKRSRNSRVTFRDAVVRTKQPSSPSMTRWDTCHVGTLAMWVISRAWRAAAIGSRDQRRRCLFFQVKRTWRLTRCQVRGLTLSGHRRSPKHIAVSTSRSLPKAESHGL